MASVEAVWGLGAFAVDAVKSVDPISIVVSTTNSVAHWFGLPDQVMKIPAAVAEMSPLLPHVSVPTKVLLEHATKASIYEGMVPATKTVFAVQRESGTPAIDLSGFFFCLFSWLFSLPTLVFLTGFCLWSFGGFGYLAEKVRERHGPASPPTAFPPGEAKDLQQHLQPGPIDSETHIDVAKPATSDAPPDTPQQSQLSVIDLATLLSILTIIFDGVDRMLETGKAAVSGDKNAFNLENWLDTQHGGTTEGTVVGEYIDMTLRLLDGCFQNIDATASDRLRDLTYTVIEGNAYRFLYEDKRRRGLGKYKDENVKLRAECRTHQLRWRDMVNEDGVWDMPKWLEQLKLETDKAVAGEEERRAKEREEWEERKVQKKNARDAQKTLSEATKSDAKEGDNESKAVEARASEAIIEPIPAQAPVSEAGDATVGDDKEVDSKAKAAVAPAPVPAPAQAPVTDTDDVKGDTEAPTAGEPANLQPDMPAFKSQAKGLDASIFATPQTAPPGSQAPLDAPSGPKNMQAQRFSGPPRLQKQDSMYGYRQKPQNPFSKRPYGKPMGTPNPNYHPPPPQGGMGMPNSNVQGPLHHQYMGMPGQGLNGPPHQQPTGIPQLNPYGQPLQPNFNGPPPPHPPMNMQVPDFSGPPPQHQMMNMRGPNYNTPPPPNGMGTPPSNFNGPSHHRQPMNPHAQPFGGPPRMPGLYQGGPFPPPPHR